MADDDSGRPAPTLIIGSGEDSAEERSDTKDVEKISAYPERLCHACFAALSKIESVRSPGKDPGEGLLSIPDLLPDRIGDSGKRTGKPAPCAFHINGPNFDQFIWRFDR